MAVGRAITAALMAHIAGFDQRRLYLPAGDTSMHAFGVGELRLSEDAALKRIKATRAARAYPAIFTALAQGRLNLTSVRLLAPHLTSDNSDELIAGSVHRRNVEIREMLARRFPGVAAPAELPILRPVRAMPILQAVAQQSDDDSAQHAAQHVEAGTVSAIEERHAQSLLSHAIPSGDIAQLLERALDALIASAEKREFAATARPQLKPRATKARRHIPASVKRQVWRRDRGRCTFVGATGHRGEARRAAHYAGTLPDDTALDERLRAALRFLRPAAARSSPSAGGSASTTRACSPH